MSTRDKPNTERLVRKDTEENLMTTKEDHQEEGKTNIGINNYGK